MIFRLIRRIQTRLINQRASCMKVKSTITSFFGERLWLPGEVFEIPDDCEPSRNMTVVGDGAEDSEVEPAFSPEPVKGGVPATENAVVETDRAEEESRRKRR